MSSSRSEWDWGERKGRESREAHVLDVVSVVEGLPRALAAFTEQKRLALLLGHVRHIAEAQ